MNLDKNNYVAIMAGGVGSRFWPASREANPKQFLDILGVGKSLLQLTYERFLSICPKENIFIVTNGIYKDLVKKHLPDITDNQILCEPSRNNTAPCVAYAALKLQALNPEANLIVAPSDHIILNQEEFIAKLTKALFFTKYEDALVTLGIEPTRPDTGYGYIRYDKNGDNGISRVLQFTEKPPLEKAQVYLESGDYVWNAGIFVWSVKSLLNAFQKYAPEIYTILSKGNELYNTSSEQAFIDENYPMTPSISIDYAIMEKANNVFTIPADFGWSDLGTWASLHAEANKDDQYNVVNTDNIILKNVKNCLIRAPKEKLVLIQDLADYIIVDENDVLMIFPKNKEQEIKNITKEIEQTKGKLFL